MITITMSEAVACALSFDDLELRKEYGDLTVKRLKKGYKVSGSKADMERLRYRATREPGWDLSPQTIYACNLFSRKLRKLIDNAIVPVDENGEAV